eukprot:5978115-Alexandrium_andersonii.AAC.1
MPPDSARNAEPPMKDSRARVAEPPDSARNAPEPGLGGRFTTRLQNFRGWCAVLPRGIAKPFSPDCRPSRL